MPPNPSSLTTSLRALPRAAWFIFAGTFINRCGMLVVPFLTLYLTRHGYRIGDAALALLAYGLGNLLATIIGGHLADTIGRKHTIVLSMFTTAASMCLLPHAPNLPWVLGLTFLTGLTGEIYRPAVNALIADIVPPEHRLTAYAANRVALNAGWAFGPALAGLLSHFSWTWLFYGDALTSVIYGVIALQALPHGNRSQLLGRAWSGIWREALTSRAFLLFAGANFLAAICFNQFNSTYSLQVTDAGHAPWVFGLLSSLNGLLVVLVELPLTTVTRRFTPRHVIAVGYLLIGVGMLLAVGATTVADLTLVILVFTLGEIICLPMAAAHLAFIAPEGHRGKYMGLFGLTWSGAQLIGPAVGLRIYEVFPELWWALCGACGLFAALLMLLQPARSSS